jgi:gamma-glutamyltranspeptidase/glutathione hydrolase
MAFRLVAAAVVFASVSVVAQQPTPHRPVPPVDTMRPEILGAHGIVAAGRHYSVSAGVRMLQQGGNAVDAGVASVFAASVCEI